MNTVVIGIGNPDRGDDALGLEVIDRLRRNPPGEARLETARGDMLKVIEMIERADHAILVDAMRSGTEPGHVLRLDASTGSVKTALDSFASTHTVNLAETIELARSLGRMPGRLIVYGVEAADFTLGHPLSPRVAGVVDEVTSRIREECGCTKPH